MPISYSAASNAVCIAYKILKPHICAYNQCFGIHVMSLGSGYDQIAKNYFKYQICSSQTKAL